jgi:hypothetical protein
VAAVVLLGWSTADDPASSVQGAARAAGAVWLLGHLVDIGLGLPTDEGGRGPVPLTLSPLGLTALVVALHVRSGLRWSRLSRAWGATTGDVVGAVIAGAAVSGILAFLVASWAGGPGVDVAPVPAAVTVAAVAAASSALGVLADSCGRGGPSSASWLLRPVQRWVSAAVAALATWWLGASLLVAAGLVLRIAEVVDRHAAVAAGPIGGVILLLAQALVAPNLVVWAGAVLAGPGFTIGAGAVTPAGSTVDELPALPLLTALGPAGAHPVWAWAGAAVVVAAGGIAAWHVHRRPTSRASSVTDRLADALAVAGLCGLATGTLAWVSSGAFGAWGPVTVDPTVTALAVGSEVLLGAATVGVVLHLLDGRPIVTRSALRITRRTGRRPTSSPRTGSGRVAGRRTRWRGLHPRRRTTRSAGP